MSWPSERVLNRALRELLGLIGQGDLWTADGPTAAARSLYRKGGGSWSKGYRTLFFAAFALWNAENTKATLGLVVHKLDTGLLDALLSLALACPRGDAGVESWIADADARRGRGPATALEHALLRAAIQRDPPGDDLMAWLIGLLPDASHATVLNAYAMCMAGAFGDVAAVGDEEKAYLVAGYTVTSVPFRLAIAQDAEGTAAREPGSQHARGAT